MSRIHKIYRRILNIEIKVLLSVLLVVGSIWIFFLIANEVSKGTTQSFDVKIIEHLRNKDNSPAGPVWLPDLMRDITSLGGGTVIALITFIVIFYLLLLKKYAELLLVLAAVIGGTILGLGLKEVFARERPDDYLRLIKGITSLSFPSGHSMMSTVIYVSLAALLARIQHERKIRIYIVSVALFLAFIIGLSRVYLGVHYPTDVIGGWTIGLAWASLCWFSAKYLQRKKVIEEA